MTRIVRDRDAEQIAGMYQTKFDGAGKKYLQPPDRNTVRDWLLTLAALIIGVLLIYSPLLWPN